MQAQRSAAAAVVLLTIAQMSAAYVVPEMIVMRMKRNPEPMRSFSFSGFNPNGQMAAFTGAAEYPGMFGNYGPPPQAGPYNYGPPTQDSYGPPTQDSYGPQPTGIAEQQVADPSKNKPEYGAADSRPEYGPSKPVAPAASDSNEQSNNGVKQTTNNKKQYEGHGDGPSSNAEASFNAWFPIMFGVFPNGSGGSQSGSNPANRGQGQSQDQGSSYGGNGGFERLSGGTTVIANSVSNGKHGVATSHAIAYGNPRQQKEI